LSGDGRGGQFLGEVSKRLNIFPGPRTDMIGHIGLLQRKEIGKVRKSSYENLADRGLMPWDCEFEFLVPRHGTLRDAATHIMKLLVSEKRKAHWQTAAEVVLMAAEDRDQ
jgi:hypothetical protein